MPMPEEIEVKTWPYHDGRRISLFLQARKITAKVYSASGEVEHEIPSYDMNLPKEISNNASQALLSKYLQDTYIRLRIRSDNSVALYINPRVNGAGLWGFLLGVFKVVVGVVLTVAAGPIGAVIGGGLIGAGINSCVHSARHEDFTPTYWKKSIGGFVSGAVMGLAGGVAGAIRAATPLKTIIARGTTLAIGGGIAEAANGGIVDGKVKCSRVLTGAVTGAVIGGGSGALAHIPPSSSAVAQLTEEAAQATSKISNWSRTGSLVSSSVTPVVPIVIEEVCVREAVKPLEKEINKQKGEIHSKNETIHALREEDALRRRQIAAKTQDAIQLIEEKNALDEERKELQKKLDKQQRHNIHMETQELPNNQQYPGTLFHPEVQKRNAVPQNNPVSNEEHFPTPITRPNQRQHG